MAPADTLAKVAVLLAKAQEQHAAMAETLADIQALVAGENFTAVIKDVETTFCELWAHRYHGAYAWAHKTHNPQVKKLVRVLGQGNVVTGVATLKARMKNYIRSSEPYYRDARHGFLLFASQINRFADDATAPFELAPTAAVGCAHEPPCTSDRQHTSRMLRDMRGGA